MRNYVIINGVNSLTIKGLAINELPPIVKAPMRVLQEEIDGRDGDIITDLGYGAYDKIMTIGLYDGYDINEIIAFFNNEGTIVFSDEADKYYNFKIIEQIDYERLIKFRTASIAFHCQPFKYPLTETPVEITNEYVEAEGTNLTLTPTADAPMEIDLKGNTQQDSTTGKQLFDIGTSNNDYQNTDNTSPSYLTINGNTLSIVIQGSGATRFYRKQNIEGNNTFTINSTTSVNEARYFVRIRKLDDSGWMTNNDYTFTTGWTYNQYFGGWYINVRNGNNNKTFTIPNCLYWQIGFGWDTNIYEGTTQKMSNIMLQSGSTTTNWEPYTNGASPNPDYPQEIHNVSGDNTIEICGKNLFDGILEQGSLASGYPTTTTTRLRSVNFTRVEPNTPYIAKVFEYDTTKDTPNVIIVEYDNNQTYIQQTTWRSTYQTITTTNETKYIKFIIKCGGAGTTEITPTYITQIQLEKSSTATTYEAYTGQSQLISLGDIELNKIGNYQDYFYKTDKWYLHKEIGKVVLDGSESWQYISITQGSLFRNNDAITNDINDNTYIPYSNNYKGIAYINYLNRANNQFYIQPQNDFLDIIDNRYTTETDFKNWLSTHNTIVYYVLDTPQDIPLEDLIGE